MTKDGEVQWIGAAEQYLAGQKSHGKLENILRVCILQALCDEQNICLTFRVNRSIVPYKM